MRPPQSQSHTSARQTLEEFSADLQQLRLRAGEPSFRAMAKTSGCISHTTLHDAAKGVRFPSWETTEQFVLACGGDVGEWRERWVAAQLASHAVPEEPAVEDGLLPAPDPAGERGERTTASPAAVVDPGFRPPVVPASRGLRFGLFPAVLSVAAALVLGFVLGRVTVPAEVADPPVSAQAEDPAESGALVAGDAAEFMTDVTLSDGTAVGINETHTKIWRFRNSGSVPWEDRYLVRDGVSANVPCDTADRVEIPSTAPGETVDISVEVRTAESPTHCKVLWYMADESGEQLFPGGRPVFFDVVVE